MSRFASELTSTQRPQPRISNKVSAISASTSSKSQRIPYHGTIDLASDPARRQSHSSDKGAPASPDANHILTSTVIHSGLLWLVFSHAVSHGSICPLHMMPVLSIAEALLSRKKAYFLRKHDANNVSVSSIIRDAANGLPIAQAILSLS
jgi:hypothetical protein